MPYPPALDGRFFILVKADDGNEYQIKFNLPNTKGNQKEFIANFVSREMGVTTLEGAFIELSTHQKEKIAKRYGADIRDFGENKFFGVKWYSTAKRLKNEKHLHQALQECKNKQEFFAIFPFDQYLRNYDRFYKNHLIITKDNSKKPSHYVAIDGDRIFGSTGIDRIDDEKDKWDCFQEPYHEMLYSLVGEKEYTQVYKYLASIGMVQVHLLMQYISSNYTLSKEEYDKIREILEYRKDKMFEFSCDGSCFPALKKKRL